MNILGANSYEEGTTLLCTWSTMGKNQGFRPADHPRSATKVQKRYRRRSSTRLANSKPPHSSYAPRTDKVFSYGRKSIFMRRKLQFHTEETPVSYGGNSSFIGKKLQFHRKETLIDPVGVLFLKKVHSWGGVTEMVLG